MNDKCKKYHTRKSLFHHPPLPSFVFKASSQNSETFSKRETLKYSQFTPVSSVSVTKCLVCRELVRVQHTSSSSLSSSSHTRPHPLRLHIFMYPLLLREAASERYFKLITQTCRLDDRPSLQYKSEDLAKHRNTPHQTRGSEKRSAKHAQCNSYTELKMLNQKQILPQNILQNLTFKYIYI